MDLITIPHAFTATREGKNIFFYSDERVFLEMMLSLLTLDVRQSAHSQSADWQQVFNWQFLHYFVSVQLAGNQSALSSVSVDRGLVNRQLVAVGN